MATSPKQYIRDTAAGIREYRARRKRAAAVRETLDKVNADGPVEPGTIIEDSALLTALHERGLVSDEEAAAAAQSVDERVVLHTFMCPGDHPRGEPCE